MPGGLSGLSLSEMGISTVKKSANAIKKAGTGVVQQVAQQVTGQTPNQIPTSKPEPVFETDDSGNPLGFFKTAVKQVAGSSTNPLQQQQQSPLKPDPQYFTDDSGNPMDLLGGAVKQVQGMGNTNKPKPAPAQQQGTFVMPKASDSKSPSEISSQQAGGLDLSKAFEQNIYENSSIANSQPQGENGGLTQEFAQQKVQDEQKIEALRKQLHQMYYDELVKKSEGKDQKKEETVQEKLEREEQEKKEKEAKEQEEKKKKEEVPMAVKGRQGAHEGLKKQG